MKAVLSGTSADWKLYYIIDAGKTGKDGAVVTNDDHVIYVNFFSFVSSAPDFRRIMKTPFHKFLWTEPDGEMKKIWLDTFISKKRPLGKKFTENIIISSQLGSKAKKQKKVETRVKSFLNERDKGSKQVENFSRLYIENKNERPQYE
jgi:hypothetical protein